jgi:1,4-alpha-glucan branching enzyme
VGNRRWDLVDDPLLRYRWLNDFDRALNEAAEAYGSIDIIN